MVFECSKKHPEFSITLGRSKVIPFQKNRQTGYGECDTQSESVKSASGLTAEAIEAAIRGSRTFSDSVVGHIGIWEAEKRTSIEQGAKNTDDNRRQLADLDDATLRQLIALKGKEVPVDANHDALVGAALGAIDATKPLGVQLLQLVTQTAEKPAPAAKPGKK
jgi:hypothetical protein